MVYITPQPPRNEGAAFFDKHGVMVTSIGLSPIFYNAGNHTEVIIGVSEETGELGPDTHCNFPVDVSGPYVLKAGDAIVVPIDASNLFSPAEFHAAGRSGAGKTNLFVRIVALRPNGSTEALAIPYSHLTFDSDGHSVGFTEEASANYPDKPIDIFRYPSGAVCGF